MNPRFLLDEDTQFELAEILRARGVDAIHVQESGRKGLPDDAQLRYAIKNKRAMLTFNVRDFVLLHNLYVRDNTDHFGIIVSKQIPLRVTLARILRIVQSQTQESLKNNLLFLYE